MKRPLRLSEWQAAWMLNLFPPFLFGGVRVLEIVSGFRGARVRIARSLFTRNLQGTTFGGVIFAAADPIVAILYWQWFAHRGVRVQAWLKSATISYRKPAATALTLEFALTDADLDDAGAAIEREGRFERAFRTAVRDAAGDTCAEIETLVHLRRPREGQRAASGF